ncbi:hypothetical protein SB784_37400, partial [Burkholderia sp. SIMBA_048]
IITALLFLGQVSAQSSQKEKSEKTTMKLISPDAYTTFKVNSNLSMYRVSFKNQYAMEVVGHLFIPKSFDLQKKYAAIIV